MSKASGRLDMAANLLLIVVSITVVGLFIQHYVSRQRSVSTNQGPTVGERVAIEDVKFSGSKRSVLIVMQQGCQYCEKSVEFYQRLVQNKGADVNVIAVFPKLTPQTHDYLVKLGMPDVELRQTRFESINVVGTPTIIVLDDSGRVTNTWKGKLSPEKEDEVIGILGRQNVVF